MSTNKEKLKHNTCSICGKHFLFPDEINICVDCDMREVKTYSDKGG